MESPANLILFVVILLNFFILGSSRLGACIRTVALQGALLSCLPLLMHPFSGHSLFLSLSALILKGFLMPWLIFRAIRTVQIRREIEPMIGYAVTLVLGTLATAGAFIFGDQLPLVDVHGSSIVIPGCLATLATGFLMLITRSKAVTQVLGYLIFENGVYIFGLLLTEAMPVMVEAGVLLDLLVAVFVIGIMINQINREFAAVHVENLSSLRE